MAETNSTILIPDISGFTEFMTTTELGHSSLAINMLIDAILNAVGEEYEVSEIEGDAVLLIKKGPPPAKQEILDICIKIFNAFHFQRKWMEQYTICPCGACQALPRLTLKFVVHHGPLAEIRVGKFIKQSGTEMIVAHRLLKNKIDNNEYLLLTEKLLQQVEDSPETLDLEWASSAEEYASIGTVKYRFALLNNARRNVPEPPAPNSDYKTDETPYFEIPIVANFRDVYMVMMNIPARAEWMPGLQRVDQDVPNAFVGSVHQCKFENYEAVISPLRMTLKHDEITYAESCRIKKMDVSVVHEFVFKKQDENTCSFATRFMNADESPISQDVHNMLLAQMKEMAKRLKEVCESMEAFS